MPAQDCLNFNPCGACTCCAHGIQIDRHRLVEWAGCGWKSVEGILCTELAEVWSLKVRRQYAFRFTYTIKLQLVAPACWTPLHNMPHFTMWSNFEHEMFHHFESGIWSGKSNLLIAITTPAVRPTDSQEVNMAINNAQLWRRCQITHVSPQNALNFLVLFLYFS